MQKLIIADVGNTTLRIHDFETEEQRKKALAGVAKVGYEALAEQKYKKKGASA